ncbi:cell division protein SepF [uncultured Megamonas sp.]|uniref:cell division protein SepF n=1 Tax=uncultured Megamonas sp. TaxID=286140 RepID=UPI0025D9A96D|nr:cell division protein SepF [uncultured Megamonas sp.]
MKLVDKIRNKMGQNSESEEYIEEVENTDDNDVQATNYQNPDNVVDFKNKAKTNNQLKVMVIEPVSFDDAQQVADHIRNHKPVVVNFENTNSDVAKRIIDFISGTTYALSGDIKKVGKNVFMCAPDNVSVNFSEELKKNTTSTSMPWEE